VEGEIAVQTFLRGGTLIDGTGREPVANATLVIDGERVHAIERGDDFVVPDDAWHIDCRGKTIVPGLIDAHDHLVHTNRDLNVRVSEPLSLTMMRIADNLRVTLEAGITTVRDAAGLDLGFKLAVEQGLIPGPRLVISLTIISRTGGIDDPHTRSGIDLSWRNLPWLPSPVADGVEGCRKRVREVLHAGADVVKCASTGGVSSLTLTALTQTMSRAELDVIVEEARYMDRRTMCHAYGGGGLQAAVDAGIDSIEHGAALCHMPETIEKMAAQGTYLVPTLTILALHRQHGSPWAKRKATELYGDHLDTIRMAREAGIPIVMGTDAGGYGHGHNAVELQYLVEAGLTPMESIVAGTKTAAECLGMEREIGTLERGKYADLLVVDGDPLADVGMLDRQERLLLVMKGGAMCVDRLTKHQATPASR
jgi:imidazolonepropionase-like amidohydrolase